MILNFHTDRSGQTVQTLIRLLLEEQSDQGLHCLLFHLYVFDKIPSGFASLFEDFVLLRRAISLKVNYEKVKFSNCVFCDNFSDYKLTYM